LILENLNIYLRKKLNMVELLDLPTSEKKLLVEMYRKGVVSARTQSVYSKFSFYIAVSELKALNLIEPNGIFKGGEPKEWRLTEEGKKLARLIIRMDKFLREIREMTKK